MHLGHWSNPLSPPRGGARRTTACACLVVLTALAAWSAACGADPQQVKREAMHQGDAYLAGGKAREAIIEYRRALQADPRWAAAHRKLARAYMQVSDPAHALEAYTRAADLDSTDTASQLEAVRLLIAAHEFERARWRAGRVVEREPHNVEALILLGHALAGLGLPRDAVRQMEDAIAIDPADPRGYTALGSIRFSLGDRTEAESAFRRAVDEAPESLEARLALASYYFAVQRREDAEREFERAHDIAPADELTNRAIATFYVNTGRAPAAEPYFVAAAKVHPRARLALVDYYMLEQRLDDADRALRPLEQQPGLSDSVQTRLAAIRYAQSRREEAHAILDRLLAKKSGRTASARAMVLKGRFLLAEGHTDEAIAELRNAITRDPGFVAAHYTLGRLLFERRDLDGARAAFQQVLRVNPHATIARLELSRVALAAGDARRAERLAGEAVTDDPDHAGARLAYIETLRAAGHVDQAEAQVDGLIAKRPGSTVLWLERGSIKLSRGDLAGARAAFTRASQTAPDAIEPAEALLTVDARDGRLAQARTRLASQVERHPTDARWLVLAGRAAAVGRDYAEAERLLERAITRDPALPDAYALLGQVLVADGRSREARRAFERLVPMAPAAAHTVLGLLDEQDGRRDAAADHYRRALDAESGAAVAANNLAWIRVGEGRVDEAVRLARQARTRLPDRPEMNDTLGWMLHVAGRHDSAVQYLRRAVDLAGTKAIYHYHLGMAYAALGDRQHAEASLKRALALDPAFPGHEDARRALTGAIAEPAAKQAAITPRT